MDLKVCKKCGQCCKEIHIYFSKPLTTDEQKVFEYKGGKITEWGAKFISPCRWLGPDNLCKIYRDRPLYCREYFCKEAGEVCE